MGTAMVGFMQDEVVAGRMDVNEAFDFLAKMHIEECAIYEKQYDEAIDLLRDAGRKIISMKIEALNAKERETAILRTAYQTWSYLGEYTNDGQTATHVKRLLQNCLLVRGTEAHKVAVKTKLLSPPPVKWWKRPVWWQSWCYTFFGVSVAFFASDLGCDPIKPVWAAFWLLMAFLYAGYIAIFANPRG